MREWWDRRLLPLYRRVELLLLLLLLVVMLLLQYPVQVGAVRVEGVAAAAATVDATAAADGSCRRFGNLAVAHLAADHAAGRVLCRVRFRFMVRSFTAKWFGDNGFC